MIANFDQIPETALAWFQDGRGAALATVIETWGSAPRAVGAQLAISGAGDMMGSVSGGCVEGAVVVEALETLETGTCQILEFGVSDQDAFAVGLACGGTIRVLVEPIGPGQGWRETMLNELVEKRAAREAVAVQTDLTSFNRRFVTPSAAPDAFAADKSSFVEGQGTQFLAIHNPPLRLAIIGAVHIAQPLALMARSAGYDTTIIDPRSAFGSAERFPGEKMVADWPDEALRAHGLDARTAVVTLTHDPKLDDPALQEALASPVFYIGALGSTRTHAKRIARLTEAGFSEAEIARIDAPIGLDIGARTPAEIAVAAMAEMTERLRRPGTRPGARQSSREVA
ncbi:MAG: XdhC/CoxI family protein [Pseudomonadota bacterium]